MHTHAVVCTTFNRSAHSTVPGKGQRASGIEPVAVVIWARAYFQFGRLCPIVAHYQGTSFKGMGKRKAKAKASMPKRSRVGEAGVPAGKGTKGTHPDKLQRPRVSAGEGKGKVKDTGKPPRATRSSALFPTSALFPKKRCSELYVPNKAYFNSLIEVYEVFHGCRMAGHMTMHVDRAGGATLEGKLLRVAKGAQEK